MSTYIDAQNECPNFSTRFYLLTFIHLFESAIDNNCQLPGADFLKLKFRKLQHATCISYVQLRY